MEFTYRAYRGLLRALRDGGYAFADYFSWQNNPRCVILRHDIDFSLDDAVALSRLEADERAPSVWFVLLKTDFYNPWTAENRNKLQELRRNGGQIGLHFDESQYQAELEPLLRGPDDAAYRAVLCDRIRQEAALLSTCLEQEVTAVAMHCPSQGLLQKDLEIPGLVNTYGKTFFRDFKYLSDSRMHWREDVDGIIAGGNYPRIQLLTHAFWYRETPMEMGERLRTLCRGAARERYESLRRNFSRLEEVLLPDEL